MDVRRSGPHEAGASETGAGVPEEAILRRVTRLAHDFNNLLGVILVYAALVEEEVSRGVASDERWAGVARDVAQIKQAAEGATRLTSQLLSLGGPELAQPPAPGSEEIEPAGSEPAQDEAQPRSPHSGSQSILVVEDEPAMREVARRILERNGYVVLAASGGAEAIAIAESHDGPIDLLVTDVVMPRMLGKEVAARLTAMRHGLRVLYMSGYAHPVLASRGTLEAGVMLLEKPFTEEAMLAKVRAALDAPSPEAAAQPQAPRAVRVVVIDDQAMVATTFARLIEKAGMEVVAVAETVASGLAAVAQHAPDVVVVDYLLPDGLGTDAVERILALDPSARVVMASGSDTPESREAAMQAGSVAYVDKAAAVHTLVPAVRQAAGRDAAEREI